MTAMFDEWLYRFLSLGMVLTIASGLTLAKAVTIASDFANGRFSAGLFMDSYSDDSASPSPLPTVLNEENFVPWPSNLPEPAAGPANGDDSVAGSDGEDQASFDPSIFTEGEILALQQLAARREALDKREEMLDIRAALNGQAETRIDKQIERLTELKAQLQALVQGLDESEERKLARLVKIYETMKPKAAAEIFNRLEISILIHVIERMKEAKSAAVLGKMDPAIAKRVTTELARKKERPDLASSAAGDGA